MSLARTAFDESWGRFSPDARWIAYFSNEAAAGAVYLRPAFASGGQIRVSPGGGRMPRRRRDGKELFCLSSSGDVTAVPIR